MQTQTVIYLRSEVHLNYMLIYVLQLLEVLDSKLSLTALTSPQVIHILERIVSSVVQLYVSRKSNHIMKGTTSG